MFSWVVCLLPESSFCRPNSNPSFRLIDSGSPRTAIRSVTHLVLALGRVACSHLRTERNQQVALAWFPPARFLGHLFLMPAARFCQAARRAPTAAAAAARKRSVPGRVHAVFKKSGSWAARAGPVQHLVDSRRGRIASKFIFHSQFLFAGAGERAHPISPAGLTPTPALACPRSP